MNSRTMDPGSVSSGTQNPSDAASGHGFINMVKAMNLVTHAKDYSTSQLDLGKETSPPESRLQSENPTNKPEAPPRIPKGVLKLLSHNPNAQAAQNYLVVEDLSQNPCAMSAFKVL